MANQPANPDQDPQSPWSISRPDLLNQLRTATAGLSENEADKRIGQYGPNLLKQRKRSDPLTLLLAQFKSPIIIILIFAGALSFFVPDQ